MSDHTPNPRNPVTDSEGEPVDVVKDDIKHPDPDTGPVDRAITPSSTRAKEQDAEKLERRNERTERKL